ncbi:uncharacterized protein LOC112268643 [Brachypodium distachyon]|uniref:DUF629 domain-containing protein n=1 Tax=Brachypodium distachyon TaxID=15368 RepID=A0A2K2CMT8_BRADI|nr:uncharacterized protein LOC112268643 [Brachypodium distachyon]PNT63348.1 hypothetical protein BRADI_4g14580v3 [Brachypodium distachyon]|eukprot:XP_024310322.1 uncharacterized protein LOC112268643 [Brachypodium distachyon]
MVKPAAGAGAGADLRKEAEAAVKLDRDGRHDEALARVDELAAGHAGSSVVLYAAGRVHYAQARRAKAAGEKEAVAHHLTTAHVYLTEAKRLVPNCIDISVLLSRVLIEAARHGEAGAELRRAIGIHSPVDPAENNVDMYGGDACTTYTKDQRVENSRETARLSFQAIREWICDNDVALVVRKACEVELGANDRQGMAQALRTANDLAKSYPQSSRAQLFRSYMKLNFARSLDATIDRRPFLDHIKDDMPEIVNLSNGSLVLSLFRAKLCFVLGSYEDAYLECLVAFGTEKPVDPKLEDVPPGSVKGEESADRLSSIYSEFARLIGRLLWVAKDYWDSMTIEKQDSFLSVRLIEVHKYYHESYESDHWAARTISDALSFVKKTKSWRFWICPYCVGKKLPDADSVLRHLCSKHPADKDLLPKLHLILDPKLSDDTCVDDDFSLDEMITVGQDSEDHYLFQFKNTDHIFEHLFLPASSVTEEESFAEIRGEKCKMGTEVLEKMKQRLKDLPTDKLSAEFDKAHREVQELWCDFLTISMLDYRTVILPLVETFLWNELIKDTSGDNAASKSIDNADIDTVFPDVIYDPGSNALVQNFYKLSDGNEDHKSGDDQETENMKPSSLDNTLVDDEKGEESGPLVEDRNSGTVHVVDKKSSDPTIDMDESRISKLAARIANVELGSTMNS